VQESFLPEEIKCLRDGNHCQVISVNVDSFMHATESGDKKTGVIFPK